MERAYRWWRTTFAAPREGPLFVVMHVPPFDARPGGHHAMRDQALTRQLRKDCTREGAAAVLCGHIHESHVWVRHGVPYVVSSEGGAAPTALGVPRMTWVQVSGANVCLTQAPIWDVEVLHPANAERRVFPHVVAVDIGERVDPSRAR